ncbi:MAG: glycosyltransferase [Beijerinckiaceae bacterium]|nr:glycosyltransferase [Beijerinckiaceae bacterium]
MSSGLVHLLPQTTPRRMHDGAGEATDRLSERASRRGALVPVSLICLHQAGAPPDRLLAATRIGAALNIPPEQVMLREGWISERDYYRSLARWLGLPFVEEPFALGRGAHYPQSIVASIAQHADGAWICAPEARRIETLALFRRRPAPIRVSITTPTNLRLTIERAFAPVAARHASRELARRDVDACALGKPNAVQIAAIAALVIVILASLSGHGLLHLVLSSLVCALLGAAILLRLLATAKSSGAAPRHTPLCDVDLPVYTVIVALHREAAVVRRLVNALDALDYPRAKLDIKLVIEVDDHETRRMLEALDLPPRYHIVIAPDGRPRTKPRALNVALAQARGELVTVYDAEDEPEPDQLRKSAAAFATLPAHIGCVQGRLAIDNFRDGWISSLFAIEYAALFEVINPGLSALNAPVALGGTSNHFRATALRDAGGWDAWNVTEDIDLGFRLARHGYSVGALDSSTYEEAPAQIRTWINQRRRWFKGWMQTLVTHTREPGRFVREAGRMRAGAAMLLVAGALIGPMFGPAFALALLVSALSGDLFALQGAGGVVAAVVWGAVCLGGLASAIWPALLGLRRRGLLQLAVWLPLLPVYWALLSIAAWWALYDFIRNPFYWAKTDHGHAKTSWRRDGARAPARIAQQPAMQQSAMHKLATIDAG